MKLASKYKYPNKVKQQFCRHFGELETLIYYLTFIQQVIQMIHCWKPIIDATLDFVYLTTYDSTEIVRFRFPADSINFSAGPELGHRSCQRYKPAISNLRLLEVYLQ